VELSEANEIACVNETAIDLSMTFEEVLRRGLSLPRENDSCASEAAIRRAGRFLYEAAHGRIVQTPIGAIPIAPPVDPSLKERPLYLRSAAELIGLAENNFVSHSRDHAAVKSQRADRSSVGSALLDFMAGRLGAPGCWPDQRHAPAASNLARGHASGAIGPGENERGKTRSSPASNGFMTRLRALQPKK
jgi:hypothetical protein